MIFEITLSLPNAVWLRNLFVEAAEKQRSREAGEMDRVVIKNHKDLRVYQMAFDAAMKIFEVSKKFPVEERYSLTDQIRRSSRSVCANLAEAWRKRRYEAAFVAKLSDCEAESAETQTWIEFAVKCNYLDVETGRELYGTYNQVLGSLVNMINNPSPWLMKRN
jgi:four helix bundle protein